MGALAGAAIAEEKGVGRVGGVGGLGVGVGGERGSKAESKGGVRPYDSLDEAEDGERAGGGARGGGGGGGGGGSNSSNVGGPRAQGQAQAQAQAQAQSQVQAGKDQALQHLRSEQRRASALGREQRERDRSAALGAMQEAEALWAQEEGEEEEEGDEGGLLDQVRGVGDE